MVSYLASLISSLVVVAQLSWEDKGNPFCNPIHYNTMLYFLVVVVGSYTSKQTSFHFLKEEILISYKEFQRDH